MGVFFMEKYGFVYIWYDCKRKMYYVGCHWGTEHDGYICSSRAWSEGKYASRKPNNMREYIWVKQQNGLVTRIHKDNYDPLIHTRGRKS